MAKRTFDNIADLAKYFGKVSSKAISNGGAVEDLVVGIAESHVQTDVYDKYTPTHYQRTGELKESWDHEEIDGGIAIFNTKKSEDYGYSVAEVVETGQGYQYDFEYSGVPRPFIENTKEELRRRKNEVVQAMKKDLKASGINVE